MDIDAAIARARQGAAAALVPTATPTRALRPERTPDAPTPPAPTVRCGDCRHVERNPRTPAAGWALCRAGQRRADGWPGRPRRCDRFEDAP